MWVVYILLCSDNTFYTGITNNLDKRLDTHNKGFGAKYTRGRRPVSCVYSKDMVDRSSALKEEYRIKQLTRLEKLELIKSDGRINL